MVILRELGFMETRMHLMHSLFRGTTQGGLALRVEGDLDVERFTASLCVVKARHEILGCVIREHDDRFYFVKSNSNVPLLSVMRRTYDDDWHTQLQELNNEPIPAQTLWRVVVLTPAGSADAPIHDILLFVHHAIMDGTAADTFLGDVLEHYAGLLPETEHPVPLPPPAEYAVPSSLQLNWDEYKVWQRDLPNANAALTVLPHNDEAPLSARQTLFDTVKFTATQTADLEQQAKSCGATLNSWLSAMLLSAVGEHTPSRERLVLHATFSLRRLCIPRIGETDIACCMAIISTIHDMPPTEIRDLALEYQGAFARAVLQQTKQPKRVILSELKTAMAALPELPYFTHDIGFTFGESRLKPQYGSLSLRHLYPIVNRSLGNLALSVHGVRLNGHGHCYFTFNHTAPLQHKNWVEKVRQSFMDTLI